MVNVQSLIPATTGGIRLKSPTALMSSPSCTVIEPSTTVISACATISSLNILDIKFGNNVIGNTYLQIAKFMTPISTSYTGFTVSTYDA